MSLHADVSATFSADGAESFHVDAAFDVDRGESLVILGPSGSGKTLLLETVAGFHPHDGPVTLDDRRVSDVPPEHRDFGFVFQDYALFPHMTITENVGFGSRYHDDTRDATALLAELGVSELADRYPPTLSGGEKQRVALARALAVRPEVMLLDEPLAALDVPTRQALRDDLADVLTDVTAVYVTHNRTTARALADRIAVMNKGRIEQIATPIEVYEEPANEFVADFIGNTNFLEGDLRETADGRVVLTLDGTDIAVNTQSVPTDGGGAVFVRPEKIDARGPEFSDDSQNTIPGRVERRLFLGSKVRYFVDIGDDLVTVDDSNKHATTLYDPGDDIVLAWSVQDTRFAHG